MDNGLIPNSEKLPVCRQPLVAAILTCVCLAVPGQLWAQKCNPHGLGLEGLPIVEITVVNSDIFDLEQENQNLLIHRWANKLHIKTRKKTIEELLLFDQGEGYSEQLVKETERLLRSRSYIHDARITAEEICGEGVKLTVRTTDNWTLTPSITASRSGGETRTSIEIEESNLLGLGTELKFLSESDEERDSNAFVFRDANWLGDFKILRLEVADSSGQFSRKGEPGLRTGRRDWKGGRVKRLAAVDLWLVRWPDRRFGIKIQTRMVRQRAELSNRR
jgi:hypothetical protein